jgi:hypothetical protein
MKIDEGKKEKADRVTGQKTKRSNDPKKVNGGSPQRKKKENTKQIQKGKETPNEERELKIIDDPLNYEATTDDDKYEVESIVSHQSYKVEYIRKYMD